MQPSTVEGVTCFSVSFRVKHYYQSSSHREHIPFLCQGPTQRQVPRTRTNIHCLRVIANNPVLACRIPITQVPSGELDLKGCALIRIEDKVVEAAEDNLRVGWSPEGEVLEIESVLCTKDEM
mgnify:CR=1 FL=1